MRLSLSTRIAGQKACCKSASLLGGFIAQHESAADWHIPGQGGNICCSLSSLHDTQVIYRIVSGLWFSALTCPQSLVFNLMQGSL